MSCTLPPRHLTRRTFVGLMAAALIPLRARRAGAAAPPVDHPDPRPGITGANVLNAEKLNNASDSTLRADSHMGKEPWNLIMAPV